MSWRYTFKDLGQLPAQTDVLVRLRGSSANVLLLNQAHFARYRAGLPFAYTGGFRRRTPVELVVPEDDHWYLVVDTGGFNGNPRQPRAEVEVRPPDRSPAAA